MKQTAFREAHPWLEDALAKGFRTLLLSVGKPYRFAALR